MPTAPVRVTASVRALIIWMCTALAFGAVVLTIQLSASPLDDPVPGDQRAGYLDSVGDRRPAPLVTISRPAPGRATVVFFVRDTQRAGLLAALAEPAALPRRVDVLVVGGHPDLAEHRFVTVSDSDGALARGYAMPEPRDEGYPVGYAIVGPDGTIRYRTLDPKMAGRLDDVRTLLSAVS
ncbi:MAG: hypothetical protein WCB04_09750 [Mycobacteriales bacterium]